MVLEKKRYMLTFGNSPALIIAFSKMEFNSIAGFPLLLRLDFGKTSSSDSLDRFFEIEGELTLEILIVKLLFFKKKLKY